MSPFRNRARPIFVWCSISRAAFGRKVADCQIQVTTDCKHGVISVNVVTNVKFHSQSVAVCTTIVHEDSWIICNCWKYREQSTHVLYYKCNIQEYTHTHTLFWVVQNTGCSILCSLRCQSKKGVKRVALKYTTSDIYWVMIERLL